MDIQTPIGVGAQGHRAGPGFRRSGDQCPQEGKALTAAKAWPGASEAGSGPVGGLGLGRCGQARVACPRWLVSLTKVTPGPWGALYMDTCLSTASMAVGWGDPGALGEYLPGASVFGEQAQRGSPGKMGQTAPRAKTRECSRAQGPSAMVPAWVRTLHFKSLESPWQSGRWEELAAPVFSEEDNSERLLFC